MLKIGDFSKLSQVSVKTLRFYDEIGLLKPTYVDRVTGYRYYSADLLTRLHRILVFKGLGFALDEIAWLLQGDLPASQARQVLYSQRTVIARRITQEQMRLAQIDVWLTQMEQGRGVPTYEITPKQVSSQWIASVRDTLSSYTEAAELFAEVRRHLRKYKALGPCAALWHACAGQRERIDCEAIIFLNKPVPENQRVKVYELPASFNACIIHQGSDATIRQAYLAVQSWVKAHGYAIAGPLREVYWEGGLALDDSSGVTEIQYPILKAPLAHSAED